jgi:protein-S-isoprenylcysteine O-methyltransferase Ste14
MSTLTVRFGRALFHWRSLTPVPIIVLLAALLWLERGQPLPGGETAGLWLDVVGVLLAILGQLLRGWVLGQVQDGTSGQNDYLEARNLNTNGPYARVRNPLYVGNLLIVAGLLLLTHSLLAAAIALFFFFGQYHFIIRAEEGFLRDQFGARFDEYCAQVPRWLPRLRPMSDQPLSHHFDWKRAIKKEHNPFTAWVSGALALWGFRLWASDPSALLAALPWLLAIEAVLLVAFFVVKAWKKGRLFRQPVQNG